MASSQANAIGLFEVVFQCYERPRTACNSAYFLRILWNPTQKINSPIIHSQVSHRACTSPGCNDARPPQKRHYQGIMSWQNHLWDHCWTVHSPTVQHVIQWKVQIPSRYFQMTIQSFPVQNSCFLWPGPAAKKIEPPNQFVEDPHTVSCAIAVPNPISIFQVLRIINDKILQQVAQDQSANRPYGFGGSEKHWPTISPWKDA